MTETYLQLPTDGSGQKMRMLSFPAPGTNGTASVLQEVVSIADGSGNLLNSFGVYDVTTAQLLRGILLRLDYLNDAVCKNYRPPDDLSQT